MSDLETRVKDLEYLAWGMFLFLCVAFGAFLGVVIARTFLT